MFWKMKQKIRIKILKQKMSILNKKCLKLLDKAEKTNQKSHEATMNYLYAYEKYDTKNVWDARAEREFEKLTNAKLTFREKPNQ